MDAGPGTSLGPLGWFIGVWIVMMAAMMLPSLAPTAAVVAAHSRRREPSGWLLFVAGYLLVWAAAGLLAYGLFRAGQSLFATQLAWHHGGRWLASGVVAFAAVYELTPPKGVCLRRCRRPVSFLEDSRLDRRAGTVALGARNGACCLGCSWALMAALFALGAMSLTWMALIAGLVLIQKLAPWRRAAIAATAAVMVVLAVGIAAAPANIPGLFVPGGRGATHAMKMMSEETGYSAEVSSGRVISRVGRAPGR
jgi:predicted metal-binding membrane protein